ncbi:endoplasmic reticulum protein [Mucor ambiguus]|uniref:Glucosidase 2 subunit beta n=1 Tax=Mucor ambiguus TaxID=91626 RepID=A0A0C9N6B3_9FUNG|nr:endoplasmic reticulum protein [Mucor ambiguus]
MQLVEFDLYQPSKDGTWTCLDGSKAIPHAAINDDYCDCSDGSDEPGTSACPNSLFYCVNEGHIPAYIKSYAVNDGVCDDACCDGSDENGELISCPNRCKQVGEIYRKEQSSLKKSTEAGLNAKRQLVEDAQKQIALWEEEQTKLEDEIILTKSNLLRLQRELQDLESRTAGSTSKKGNSSSNKVKCKSSSLEVATLKHDIVILKKELNVLKSILGDMKRDHNHNFHDMAVKSAISGYDEFVTRFTSIEAIIDDNLENINSHDDEEEDIDVDDVDNDDETDTEAEAPNEEKSPQIEGKHSVVDMVLEKLDSILPSALKNGLLDKLQPKNVVTNANDDTMSDEKAALENTRKLVREAEDQVNTLNNGLERLKKDLSTDYGVDKEWLKLKDVCIEKDEGEYTYSLCFLGDAYQKSNKDSTRTHLGKFAKFDGSDDLYKVHIHSHGTRCWNGPERSVKATIECGLNNEILDVSEPEKCEYHFRMLSPAVCKSVADAEKEETIQKDSNGKKPVHEEL